MANSSLCHRGSFGQRVPHSDEPYKACKGRPLQVDIGDLPDVTEAGARQRSTDKGFGGVNMASGKHFLKEDGHCQVSGDVAHTSDLVLRENGRCIPLSMSTIRTSSSSFVVIII